MPKNKIFKSKFNPANNDSIKDSNILNIQIRRKNLEKI